MSIKRSNKSFHKKKRTLSSLFTENKEIVLSKFIAKESFFAKKNNRFQANNFFKPKSHIAISVT